MDTNNRQWWLFEFIILTIQTGRFLFYVILSFMGESVLRSYCPYDTTAAPLFHYFNHQNNGTPLNLTDCRLTSIILTFFFFFILHSQYIIFLTDHNFIAWRLLFDVSNRNYDQYRVSIINGQNMNISKMIIKTLFYRNKFNKTISNSSSKMMHNVLKKMIRKNEKNFLDKLIIQLMLYIDLYKFEKLRLKVFSYAGLKQRIELAITMFTLHCIDVFMMILVISTTFNLGCLKYFNFIHIHMMNLWPFAIIDCINHLYCGYIFIRNCTLYFNFSLISLIYYVLQMNSLNRKLNQVFGNHRNLMNSQLNYLRQLIWQQFQRQHQHMTHCLMYSGLDIWNNAYFIAIISNIPFNILCIYNLIFRYNSLNNRFMYLGFLIFQTFIIFTIVLVATLLNFSFHQFKQQLPIIQLCNIP
uniref:Uncharacterized protein LOC113794952 n=1 Tax=Dermatophagoides pteronyssinus TaxID=6956 RepID=A0A6P6Y680_DERPT|nr:uncharacterized protein LOC113794952 [Dermatophagoides pteronyssinus]